MQNDNNKWRDPTIMKVRTVFDSDGNRIGRYHVKLNPPIVKIDGKDYEYAIVNYKGKGTLTTILTHPHDPIAYNLYNRNQNNRGGENA